MIYLNGRFYVEVKNKQHIMRPSRKITIKNWPFIFFENTISNTNDTQIRKNQKVVGKDKKELVLKNVS